MFESTASSGSVKPLAQKHTQSLGIYVRGRDGAGIRLSKPRLDFLANLSGASRRGAGGIELQVVVDVLKESRIISLAKVDDGEELVDHGDVGSEGTGLSGAGLGLGKIAFANFELATS